MVVDVWPRFAAVSLHLLKICLKTSSGKTLCETSRLPPFLTPPPPLPREAKLLLSIIEQELALSKPTDGFLTQSERFVLVACVCVVCFTGFSRYVGFYIYLGVFEIKIKEECSLMWCDLRTTQTELEVPTRKYCWIHVWSLFRGTRCVVQGIYFSAALHYINLTASFKQNILTRTTGGTVLQMFLLRSSCHRTTPDGRRVQD